MATQVTSRDFYTNHGLNSGHSSACCSYQSKFISVSADAGNSSEEHHFITAVRNLKLVSFLCVVFMFKLPLGFEAFAHVNTFSPTLQRNLIRYSPRAPSCIPFIPQIPIGFYGNLGYRRKVGLGSRAAYEGNMDEIELPTFDGSLLCDKFLGTREAHNISYVNL